ncbi:hypothetical protein GGH96_000974 [Coemansia sp. RSA 1972]|nr:hypothetical protein GGH96_000974 [Coemansia sp. RSA 1972]
MVSIRVIAATALALTIVRAQGTVSPGESNDISPTIDSSLDGAVNAKDNEQVIGGLQETSAENPKPSEHTDLPNPSQDTGNNPDSNNESDIKAATPMPEEPSSEVPPADADVENSDASKNDTLKPEHSNSTPESGHSGPTPEPKPSDVTSESVQSDPTPESEQSNNTPSSELPDPTPESDHSNPSPESDHSNPSPEPEHSNPTPKPEPSDPAPESEPDTTSENKTTDLPTPTSDKPTHNSTTTRQSHSPTPATASATTSKPHTSALSSSASPKSKHTVIDVVTVVVDGETQTSMDTKVYDDGATTPDAKTDETNTAPYTSTFIEDGSVIIVTGEARDSNSSGAPRAYSSALNGFNIPMVAAVVFVALF